MGGTRAAWLVALPLVAVGWLAAHELAYAIVAPDAHHRAQLLSETGHAYLGAAPAMVAFALTVVLCGLSLAVVERVRGVARAPVTVWPIALVAPLGFAVQEHVERLIELHALPTGAALEPTFLVGIALQLPFALAALLIARAVLAFSYAIGGAFAAARPRFVNGVAAALRAAIPCAPTAAHLPLLATGHAERAPPDRLR